MKHIELAITITDRSDTVLPNGNHEVYNTLAYRVAGVGSSNLEAFQAALKLGGSWLLETVIGIPGLLLAQLGFRTTQAS